MSTDLKILTDSPEELESRFVQHGHGLSDTEMRNESEPIGTLEVAPQVFQFRNLEHRPWEKERHIRDLVQALKRQKEPLDPILLFAVAGHRLVLDGHCRLRAYLRSGLPSSAEIPVRYVRGEFSEALTRPAAENSKATLPFTHEERLEAAWRLVRFDEGKGRYSLRKIGRCSGAGKSTVANMRKVLAEDYALSFDPRKSSWKEVKKQRRGDREVEEGLMDELIKKWSRLIRKALGDKPNESPTFLFDALVKAYPQIFPHAIPREWAEDAGIVDEILDAQTDDFEF